ncbi:MAG: leucine-rich repeat domain-containing protein, partial [Planctomycetota bacterium]
EDRTPVNPDDHPMETWTPPSLGPDGLPVADPWDGFAAGEGADAAVSRERVNVPDAALRDAINAALGRGAMDQLNRGEIGQLTTLDISNSDVASLEGLQYATSLTTLNASNNNITDTSPIAGLTNLTNTNLAGNPVSSPSDGDVPIPLWALGALGAALMGAVGRANRRKADERV